MSNNILIIGEYSREDLLAPFELLKEKTNMFFLTYFSFEQLPNQNANEFGSVVFWNEFSSGFDLLTKLDIHKIIFYEYESYNNIALRAAAKQLGIICCHLDHGFKDYTFSKNLPEKKTVKQLLSKFPFVSYFKLFFISRFYYNTYKKCNNEWKKQLLIIYKTRSSYSILSTFKKINNPLLKLDLYLVFSPENFKSFKYLHHLPENFKDYKFIGLPNFDEAFKIKNKSNKNSKKLLLIDQPFYEQNLFGWTKELKFNFLKKLKKVAKENGLKIIIKPHPLNESSIYKSLNCEIVTENIFDNYCYSYVIGFYSTLLLPISSIHSTLLICLNNHPVPFQIIENNIFVKGKVAIGLNQLSDLSEKSLKMKVLAEDRKAFTKKYLYKFDGRSKSRLTKIILSN